MIFLRPWWLILLLLPLFFLWKKYKRGFFSSAWRFACDAHLLPHVMVKMNMPGLKKGFISLLFVWSILSIAMAGPAFYKTTVQTAQNEKGLVVVLDMSPAMSEEKIFQARLKIYDILKSQKETLIGFVMVDEKAYTALPLSKDSALFQNILPTVTLDVRPALGSRPDLGIVQAGQLLRQSGLTLGRILLITAGIADEKTLMKTVADSAYSVSILGFGHAEKMPMKLSDGQFWEQKKGVPVMGALDSSALSQGALFSFASLDSSDLQYLLPSNEIGTIQKKDSTIKIYQDIGIYLVALALPFFLFLFRRGVLWVMLIVVLSASPVRSNSLWLRGEQQIYQSNQKGVAAYRAGNYLSAIDYFSKDASDDGFYNLGNVYALAGDVEKAITSYEKALDINPQHSDALFNLDLLKQQQQKSESVSSDQKSDDSKDSASLQNNSQQQNSADDQQKNNQAQSDTNRNEQSQQTSFDKTESRASNSSPTLQNDSLEQSNDVQPKSEKEQSNAQPVPNLSDTRQSESVEKSAPLSEQKQKQQEWFNRVENNPGRLLKYRLHQQYQGQLK